MWARRPHLPYIILQAIGGPAWLLQILIAQHVLESKHLLHLLVAILISRLRPIDHIHGIIELLFTESLIVKLVISSYLLNVFHHVCLLMLIPDWTSTAVRGFLQILQLLLKLSEVVIVDVALLAVCCWSLLWVGFGILLNVLHGQGRVGVCVNLQILRFLQQLLLISREYRSWSLYWIRNLLGCWIGIYIVHQTLIQWNLRQPCLDRRKLFWLETCQIIPGFLLAIDAFRLSIPILWLWIRVWLFRIEGTSWNIWTLRLASLIQIISFEFLNI